MIEVRAVGVAYRTCTTPLNADCDIESNMRGEFLNKCLLVSK